MAAPALDPARTTKPSSSSASTMSSPPSPTSGPVPIEVQKQVVAGHGALDGHHQVASRPAPTGADGLPVNAHCRDIARSNADECRAASRARPRGLEADGPVVVDDPLASS